MTRTHIFNVLSVGMYCTLYFNRTSSY